MAVFPWSHYYSSSLAPKGSKVKLYKLLSDISVRQRGILGLQGVQLATLTAVKPKSQEMHHTRKSVHQQISGSVTRMFQASRTPYLGT